MPAFCFAYQSVTFSPGVKDPSHLFMDMVGISPSVPFLSLAFLNHEVNAMTHGPVGLVVVPDGTVVIIKELCKLESHVPMGALAVSSENPFMPFGCRMLSAILSPGSWIFGCRGFILLLSSQSSLFTSTFSQLSPPWFLHPLSRQPVDASPVPGLHSRGISKSDYLGFYKKASNDNAGCHGFRRELDAIISYSANLCVCGSAVPKANVREDHRDI